MSVFPVAAYAVWKLLNEMKMLHILKKYITDHAEFDYFMFHQQSFSYVGAGLPWLNQY